MEANQEVELLTKDRDQIVLELESTRNQLEKSKETIVQLSTTSHSYEEQLASLNQEIEKSETRSSKHSRVEEVLQRQNSELQAKLESANQGKKHNLLRECVRAGAAGARTRRSLEHHLLHPIRKFIYKWFIQTFILASRIS